MMGGFHDPYYGLNSTTSTDSADIDKINQREQKAKGLLLKTVSQVLRRELMTLTKEIITVTGTGDDERRSTDTVSGSAEMMWSHLSTKFGKKVGTTPLMDFKRFMRSDLVDDGTLEAQLNKLTDIRSTCALNDFEVTDWQFASIILLALPEAYRNIADSLLSATDVKNLKIDDVKAKILDQEARRHTDTSASNHLLSSGKPQAGPSTRKEGPNDKCRYCDKHWGRGDLETSGNILGKLWALDHFSPNVSTNHILGTFKL